MRKSWLLRRESERGFRTNYTQPSKATPLRTEWAIQPRRSLEKHCDPLKTSAFLSGLRALSLDTTHPSFAASVLRCLGRQTPPGTGSWRAGLVRDGLAMEDVEIRDAAVQAAELWGDPNLLNVLEAHSESEAWLRDYIRDVIDDIGE